MRKRLTIILFSTLCVALFALGGCKSDPDHIDTNLAKAYTDFYELGASDPEKALEALDRAERADPDNAYTQYLKASLPAQKGDLEKALALVEKGNMMEKSVIYCSVPPPGDDMSTLTRARQLGFSTEKADKLGSKAEEYFLAVKRAGEKIAQSEPLTSLGVMNGIGIIRRTLGSEVSYWTKKKDEKRAKAAQEEADTFRTWQDGFTKTLSSNLVNMMEGAGKAAGLTSEELALYAAGKPLKDQSKQDKADKERLRLYDKELEALRTELKTMPKVDEGS